MCLQAVARWAGVALHFRSLNAALGLSFIISAPRQPGVSLSWWMTYGRDAFLKEAAALFGITVRLLEEPGRADDEGGANGFKEHQAPRVREALRRNQPVLAWGGWPDYRSHLWGVITEPARSGPGFAGTTMWSHGQLVPLAAPPWRLYIVEDLRPCQPDPDELLRFALHKARLVLHDGVDPAFNVTTGLPVYERWLDWLSAAPSPTGCGAQRPDDPAAPRPEAHRGPRRTHPGEPGVPANREPRAGAPGELQSMAAGDPDPGAPGESRPHSHYQMARFVIHNRESACRFIDHYRDGLHESVQPYLDALHADCQGTIAALGTARDLRAVEILFRTPDGRAALAAGVQAARDFHCAQVTAIDHLVDALK